MALQNHQQHCAVAPPDERGSKLIEIAVIIVMTGLLGVFAVPRYISAKDDLRDAAFKSLGSNVRSTAALVHGMALARGLTAESGQSVVLEGATIHLAYGYPTADLAGVVASLQNLHGFTQVIAPGPPATVTWMPIKRDVLSAGCQVVYQQAASPLAPATVTVLPPGTRTCS